MDPRSVGMVVNDAEPWMKKLQMMRLRSPSVDRRSSIRPGARSRKPSCMFWDLGLNVLVLTHLLEHPEETRNEGQAGLLFLSSHRPSQLGVTCSSAHLPQLLTGQNWANEQSQTGSCGDAGLLPDVVVISGWYEK